MNLAKKIKRLRQAAGLTPKQLAEQCSVPRYQISQWESGQAVPSADQLHILADIFNVSPAEFQDTEVFLNSEAAEEMPSLIEMNQKRQFRQQRQGWIAAAIVCLILAAGMGTLQLVSWIIVYPRGWEYITDWINPLLNLMLVGALTFSGSVFIKKTALRKIGAGAALFLIVGFSLQLQQALQQHPTTISLSENGRFWVVVKQDRNSGEAVLCRSRHFLYRREQEAFPYPVEGELKLQWLANDVCTITYRTTDHSIHQQIATFGDRGNPISYHNPISSISGEWIAAETAGTEWKIMTDREGIHLEKDGLQEDYAYSDCVPFGTLALALCREGQPQWSLVLGDDGILNEQDLFVEGQLILCPVAMQPTQPMNFVRNAPLPEVSFSESPEFSAEEAEVMLIEAMRQTIQTDPQLQQELPEGTMKLETRSIDPVWLSLLTLTQQAEAYRVNGVDVRMEITSVQRLAGTAEDQLLEVKTAEWAVSPGNQGAGPTGEAFAMTYRIRLMQGQEAVLAAVIHTLTDGTTGLKLTEDEPILPKNELSAHSFVSGAYDTTYMYVSRRSPAQALQFLLEQDFAEKTAVISEDGQQALLEENGNQTLWLLYDGISEDRQNYRFWLVRCEGPDWKHSDGQIWSEGEYTVAIREKA